MNFIEIVAIQQRAYEVAAAEAERLREDRNTAIRQAIDNGHTHKSISDATGLSRGRINQLSREKVQPAVQPPRFVANHSQERAES